MAELGCQAPNLTKLGVWCNIYIALENRPIVHWSLMQG